MNPVIFISCRQHTLPVFLYARSLGERMPLMFSVFIPRFPRQASPRSHCSRSRLIAFIVLMRFRNRKLIDGASLSLVYFTSAPLFSPDHLSVRPRFICYGSTCRPSPLSLPLFISSFLYPFLFYFPFFFRAYTSALLFSRPFSGVFVDHIAFVSYRSLVRLSASVVLVLSRLQFIEFLSLRRHGHGCVFPYIFEHVVAGYRLATQTANGRESRTRFTTENAITIFAPMIIRFRHNY